MSSESVAPQQAANLASIFQKAYARAVALQRMDEQIAAMLEQRQKLESEFRDAQGEVNAECERMLNSASIAPAKILAQMAQSAQNATPPSHSANYPVAPAGGVWTADSLQNDNGARFGFIGGSVNPMGR